MTTDNKYNGWTNYATWRINLEIFDGSDNYYTAESAREVVEEFIYETTDEGIARNYALAFLSDVNWYEIAEHYQPDEEGSDILIQLGDSGGIENTGYILS